MTISLGLSGGSKSLSLDVLKEIVNQHNFINENHPGLFTTQPQLS